MARKTTSTARKSAAGSATGTANKDAGTPAKEEGPASGRIAKEGAAAVALQWPMPFPVPDSEALAPINGKLLQHASSLGGDFMSFGQKRFGCDLETITQLCRCSSPEEVSEVQREWFDKAAEDYRRDGIELFRSAGTFFSEAMQTPFQIYTAMTGNHRDEQEKSR